MTAIDYSHYTHESSPEDIEKLRTRLRILRETIDSNSISQEKRVELEVQWCFLCRQLDLLEGGR